MKVLYETNMNNSVGYARPARFANSVALGTDGIGADMLDEFRLAYVRHREDDVTASPEDAWGWLAAGWDLFPEAHHDRVTWDPVAPVEAPMDPWRLAFTTGVAPRTVEVDGEVVLADGRKIAEGSLVDILERLDLQPATGRFEAGVVLIARVISQDKAFNLTRLDHHGQTFSIPAVDLQIGEEVRLRVRARDVALSTESPTGMSIRNVFAGTIVELREEPGTAFAETLVDIGGGRLRARITREAASDLSLKIGKPVFALVKSISFDRRSLGQKAV